MGRLALRKDVALPQEPFHPPFDPAAEVRPSRTGQGDGSSAETQQAREQAGSDRIIVQTFGVAPGPAAEQGAAYRRSISDILETSFHTDVISSQLSTFFLGPVHVAFGEATPRSSRRTKALIRRDRFESIAVQFIQRGRARGQSSNKTWVSDPGTVMFLDFGQTFLVTDEECRAYINVMIPRSMLVSVVDDVASMHGLVLSTGESAVLGGFMQGLVAGVSTLRDVDVPQLTGMFVALIGISIRNHLDHRPASGQGWLLEEAERLIELRLGAADLTPGWLALKLDVSRSELYTSFKHKGGVARWIWQRRLMACHARLQDNTDRRSIAALAEGYGFNSAAHFSRMYKSAFGISPSQARRHQP